MDILEEARNKEPNSKELWSSLGRFFKEKSMIDKYHAETDINQKKIIFQKLSEFERKISILHSLSATALIIIVLVLIISLF